MSNKSRKQASLQLTQARKALAASRTTNDPREICVAAANLGLALFKVNKFTEGARSFNEVDRIFKELDDFELYVHCLGLKTVAYQISEQHPQAFEIARKIEALAVENEALAVQSDALATQGQILIDSGEEVYALEKFNAALEIAENIDDTRRKMNVTGALGNYCMTIASPEQAESYFVKARDLARELGDRRSEIGFHGNIGALLEWKEAYEEAAEIFDEVVAYMRETGNQAAELQALRHLVQVHVKRKDDEKIIEYAKQGVIVGKEGGGDILFFFCENLISAHYRLNQMDDAQQAMSVAVELARAAKDHKREVDFMLSLGESYMQTNHLDRALACYQQALKGTQRFQRMIDKAYLLGRIGMVLAEMGRVKEAVGYHEQAVEMAQKHELLDLEGEQLVMLAMAYLEGDELDKARGYGETAVQIFTKANLPEQADKTRQLLATINNPE